MHKVTAADKAAIMQMSQDGHAQYGEDADAMCCPAMKDGVKEGQMPADCPMFKTPAAATEAHEASAAATQPAAH
jgi:hypothetical protein